MHARSRLTGLLALALAVCTPPAVTRASGPTVTIEDLGPAGFSTFGRGVNGTALAAGYGTDASSMFGFTQAAASAFVPLPVGATDLQTLAVNDAGVVTGRYIGADGFSHAFRYDTVSNALTDVPSLAGANNSTTQAINASGALAGFTTGGVSHGFRQSGAAAAEDIGDLGGGVSSAAGINSSNVVVGMSKDAAAHFQAVRFDTSLHTLASLGGTSSAANGINDSGIVVGSSRNASSVTLAARWTDDATVQSLGTLGGLMSQANAINSSGDIVGWAMTATNEVHAFLWQNGTMSDLNDLLSTGSGWVLTAAYALNDHGVIVGDGTFNGEQRAFRLTITPQADADVTPPTIAWVHASPDTLWPPNNQMVPVSLTVQASDDSGVAPTCALVSFASSVASKPGDMVKTGPMTAQLRASKSNGGECLYTLVVQCTDGAGNVATANAVVRVPKSASGK
jgi:probable HAF family extracellular repeat protein